MLINELQTALAGHASLLQ